MPSKALFIGHSLVGQVMPTMFSSFMADQGLGLQAEVQVINGAPLRWNWDNGGSAEGVNARAVLPGGAYDVVIVTEAIPLDEQIRWNDTKGYVKRYFDLATGANPDTQFYLYETWHSLGSDAGAWRAQIAADLSKWEGIVDFVNANAALGVSEALIVPAGQALGALHDAIAVGQVPGLNSIRDVFADDIHLNDLGNWFVAAVQAAVVAGADVSALPLETASPFGVNYGGPDAALAQAMAEVIDQTLASYQGDGVGNDPTPPVEEPPDTPGGLTGDGTDNTLTGGDTADLIRGLSGDDLLIGGKGDDRLDGGSGLDSAVLSGAQAHFSLTLRASALTLTDRRADGEGTDTLIDIETLEFLRPDREGQPDRLDLTQITGALRLSEAEMESFVELYIGYFNRAPDALGLSFWGTAHANGLSLSQIARLFVDQQETSDAYPDSMSNAEVVTAVYDNILGRAGDEAGLAFWQNALDSGAVARDQFILALLEGAKAAPVVGVSEGFAAQQNADRQYLADKTDIGAYFAVHLGMSDVEDATAAMALFDGTASSFERAIDQIETFHEAAEQSGSGAFLMPLVGVLEIPDGF